MDCKLDMRLYKRTNLGHALEKQHVTDQGGIRPLLENHSLPWMRELES